MPRPQEQPKFLKRLKERQKSKPVQNLPRGNLHKFANWINDWHITRISQALSSLFLAVTVVMLFIEFQARKDARVVSAWQLLTTKASGNSGKIEALEYLNTLGYALAGIDLSDKTHGDPVYLNSVNLSKADLSGANLDRIRNLSCRGLTDAKNWEKAFRNEGLACGSPIPVKKTSD